MSHPVETLEDEALQQLAEPPANHALAPQLRLFLGLSAALSLACAAAELFCNYVLHLTGPYTYPLKTRSQSCWDFTLYTAKFQHFHSPAFFLTDPETYFTYPAPTAVAYKIFFSDQAHPLRFFLGFILTSFAIAAILIARALHRRGVSLIQSSAYCAATLLLAYPLWFELKQGNIEICSWVLIALGVWAFTNDAFYAAAACFAIAGSMKIFPFVYVGLLIAARRYRETLFAALVAIATTLTSLWLLGPNIAATWNHLSADIAKVRSIYTLKYRPEEIGFDHSLFGVYKRFLFVHLPHIPIDRVLTTYLILMTIAGTLLYFLKIRRLPVINQVLCLSVASILLTPISFDYNLIYLYVAWAMLALLAQETWRTQTQAQQTIPGLTAAMICLAVLTSPQSEFIWHTDHFGGQIKALTLVALMGIGLKYPFTPAPSFESARLQSHRTHPDSTGLQH